VAKICIVTAGHLSTCPRMLKAADALAWAGHSVRVVATRFESWATAADEAVRARRSWQVTVIDRGRGSGAMTYWRSGIRQRTARAAASWIGPARAPISVAVRAYARLHSEFVAAAASEPADLFYGGTSATLAAVAHAAQRQGVPYALDLEDFHSGESEAADADFTHALAARVEGAVLGRAAATTTSSAPIAWAYHDRYGIVPRVVSNTFPLPSTPPDFARRPGPLRLYWFSQTIGPGRGLEDAIAAAGRAGMEAELHLRGRAADGYLDVLEQLRAAQAPRLALIHHPPAPPDAMVDLARGYDVGLALEQMTVLNHQLALSNKALTYILAGIAVALTDTPGQRVLGVDLGPDRGLVPAADVDALAALFARWARDPDALLDAKRAAWAAAVRRWHWEHEDDRGALCALVKEIVG
jgi:glycosyltransferase involved in cell wall biosynthesis